MIIDTNAQVTPRRYKDRELRQFMGDLLGKASSDDLFACFLWAQEGRIGLQGYRAIGEVESFLEVRFREFRNNNLNSSAESDFPFAEAEFHQAVAGVEGKLTSLLSQVRDLKYRAGSLFDKMRMQYGSSPVAPAWLQGEGSHLEAIGVLWDEALAAKRKAEGIPKVFDEALEGVRRLNERRRLFYESEKKYTLSDVDSFDHKNFEILVSWLARRDGMRAWRTGGAGDLGADVIAESPDGRRFVFQCKHTKGRRAVDSAAMQRLNGTARPIHKADVVAMVTSGDCSGPARTFANSQNIHIVGRQSLKKWSEWGDSLYEVLGIDAPSSPAAEAA